MLIVTKKFEVFEFKLFRFLVFIFLSVVAVASIASLIPSIPDNINIAASIPIGLLSTIIWEWSNREKHKIFDDEGVEIFLTKIKEEDFDFTYRITNKFLKARNNNTIVLKLTSSDKLDELELIMIFIQSSFKDLRGQLKDPKHTVRLWKKIFTNGSFLHKEFGINLNNLAFLYETNNNYFYHTYQLGSPIKLDYTLTDANLLMKKSFIDCPLFSDIFMNVNDCYTNHPKKVEYAELITTLTSDIMYDKKDIIVELLPRLYNLCLEVINTEELKPLSYLITYTFLITIKAIDLEFEPSETIENFIKNEKVGSLKKLEEYFLEYLKENEVLHFLFVSNFLDFNYFEKNAGVFKLSKLYSRIIASIYTNEINKRIIVGDIGEFTKLLDKFSKLEIIYPAHREFLILYKGLYKILFDRELISITETDISYITEYIPGFTDKGEKYRDWWEEYRDWWEKKIRMDFDVLSQLHGKSLMEVAEIMSPILIIHYNYDINFIPLYEHQPLLQFSKHLMTTQAY